MQQIEYCCKSNTAANTRSSTCIRSAASPKMQLDYEHIKSNTATRLILHQFQRANQVMAVRQVQNCIYSLANTDKNPLIEIKYENLSGKYLANDR